MSGLGFRIASILALSTLATVAIVGQSRAASLIANGDFETVDASVGSVNGNALNALQNGNGVGGVGGGGLSWDVYGALPGGWTSTFGPGIEVQRNTVVFAHSGSHYVELESHPGSPSNSSIEQTFAVTTKAPYELTYYYQPRTTTSGDNLINAYLDDVLKDTQSGPPVPPHGSWTKIVVALGILDVGSHKLRFDATGTIDNTLGGYIDTVSISAVPLPAALPLFGTGLAAVFGMARWRRRRAA